MPSRHCHVIVAVFVIALTARIAAQPAPSLTRGVLLEDLTWSEAQPLMTRDAIVVVPLGAQIKEHGLHLKLRNDWTMAEYLKKRVLASAAVLVAPTINYHFYPAFVNYAGSATLSEPTARDVVVDICRSLARHGPRRFYILNTGVSTIRPLRAAQELLKAEGIIMTFTDILTVAGETEKAVRQQKAGTHADEIETSMMLYIDPSSVDMSRARAEYPTGEGPLTPVPNTAGRYSASGVFGDATLATREKGEKLVEATVQGIHRDIDSLRRVPVP
jgi:creatinine amidohydrolase